MDRRQREEEEKERARRRREKEENRRQRDQSEHTGGDQGDDENKERDLSETNQTPRTIRIGLLNVQSMNNKESRISELIRQNNLDVFLTTETFLKHDTAVRVLREASPEGFLFTSEERADCRRGGGVAIQFSARKVRQITFVCPNITTFEFVICAKIRNDWDQHVVIINLYHPRNPRTAEQFRTFLDEFQSLLDKVKKRYSSIIVTGDFNIPAKKGERCYTDEFDVLLRDNNLTQHVEEPTHRAGNTLDLVLTRNVEISDLIVHDDEISDHYTVYFNARPTDTGEETEENENEEQNRFGQPEE